MPGQHGLPFCFFFICMVQLVPGDMLEVLPRRRWHVQDLGPWCAAVALMHILQPQPVSVSWEHMNMVVQAASGGLPGSAKALLTTACMPLGLLAPACCISCACNLAVRHCSWLTHEAGSAWMLPCSLSVFQAMSCSLADLNHPAYRGKGPRWAVRGRSCRAEGSQG